MSKKLPTEFNYVLSAEPGNNVFEAYIAQETNEEFVNSQDLIFGNVFAKVQNEKQIIEYCKGNLEEQLHNIHEKMLFQIHTQGLEGFYVAGNFVNKGEGFNSVEEYTEKNSIKMFSNVPLINSIGVVAARAVQDLFSSVDNPSKLDTTNVEVFANVNRFVTTLPVQEYYAQVEEIKQRVMSERPYIEYSKRFNNAPLFGEPLEEEDIEVTFYVGTHRIKVIVFFDNILVLPEAVAANYALALLDIETDEGKALVKDFFKKYDIADLDDEESLDEDKVNFLNNYFFKELLLHLDIGSGTTDMPVLYENKPNPFLSTHVPHVNVYNAIQKNITVLREIMFGGKTASGITVSKINNYISRNVEQIPNLKIRDKVQKMQEVIKEELKNDIRNILEVVEETLESIELNYIDEGAPKVIPIYGGGSILIGADLEAALEEIAKPYGIQIFLVPEEHATHLNQNGLKLIVKNARLFETQKEYFFDTVPV